MSDRSRTACLDDADGSSVGRTHESFAILSLDSAQTLASDSNVEDLDDYAGDVSKPSKKVAHWNATDLPALSSNFEVPGHQGVPSNEHSREDPR